MAVSKKYGKIVISKIGDNEPVFILRAQDVLAESTIELYRVLAESHKAPVAQTLKEEIEEFRRWKGSRKMPD
ncbi:MAG TPA: hypothetical protein PLG17_10070 [Thermodesulfobacteriota bacterium]|nr:hypothetical protein [Deltaproteobacteria bacterium]HNR14270.1 hypothetical protein [Thermodesulfobacteriota bacterium]HNU70905.1 hypothetical protein [Thermodesulfobacteriota bacterium]HOC38204.1 hypothetical protein [Thermodesulfobacteriota bacterium]HQO78843.1 hypothetical protein [Thermodesulfobacteriota bacterium]